MFSDKLDALMNITNTRNSDLGKGCSFDPSYVSRLRSGSRELPGNSIFAGKAASFLTRRLDTDFKLRGAADITGRPDLADLDIDERIRVISEWLISDSVPGIKSSGITRIARDASVPESGAVNVLGFYGNEGKREAVLKFFETIKRRGKPHTLLLYSDENMSWMYEDPRFASKWNDYMNDLLRTGSSIKIIHSFRRDMTDLMEAVSKWLPLYLTGRIEPFYYPRLRDGLCRRSLFVARGCCAAVANSVSDNTSDTATLFTDDGALTASFDREFMNIAALCKPLLATIRNSDKDLKNTKLLKRMQEAADKAGRLIICGSGEAFPFIENPESLSPQIQTVKTSRIPAGSTLVIAPEVCAFLFAPDGVTFVIEEASLLSVLTDFITE